VGGRSEVGGRWIVATGMKRNSVPRSPSDGEEGGGEEKKVLRPGWSVKDPTKLSKEEFLWEKIVLPTWKRPSPVLKFCQGCLFS